MTQEEINNMQDGIVDYIQELMNNIPEEEKSNIAYFIAYQATVFGSYNTFEGVGILEAVKLDYIDISEKILREELESKE